MLLGRGEGKVNERMREGGEKRRRRMNESMREKRGEKRMMKCGKEMQKRNN